MPLQGHPGETVGRDGKPHHERSPSGRPLIDQPRRRDSEQPGNHMDGRRPMAQGIGGSPERKQAMMIEMQQATQGTRNRGSRRRFMALLGMMGAGAVGTAIAPDGVRIERQTLVSAEDRATAHEQMPSMQSASQQPATGAGEPTADEMDAMHEAGIKSFPAKTKGLGGQPLDFTLDGDVKVFALTCSVIQWEVAPGQQVEA